MANDFVKLYDTITITPASVDSLKETKEFKDFVSSGHTPSSLCCDVIATHAARLTRNNGFYLPQKMKLGVDSMVEPYNKPVLKNHNQHEDPIGRIVAAKYIDTSNAFARDSAHHGLFQDLCNPRVPYLRQVELIIDKLAADTELLRDPNYPGLGHILATINLTDEDAIKKVLDKRILTVSTGASTDKAICSCCKQDWVEEGPCEHIPGKMYDKKLAFIIAGLLTYDELSSANVPADVMARIVTINNGVVQDTVVVEDFGQDVSVSANFFIGDAIIGGSDMTTPKKVEDGKTPHAKADVEKEKGKKVEPKVEPKKDEPDPDKKGLKEKLFGKGKKDKESADDTADDTIDWDSADTHYEDMIKLGNDLSLFDDEFEKRSTEDRQKMAKSTFGLPGNRTYPIPDQSHARAAMALAKQNDEPASVISCILRKAKALGCPFLGDSKKDADFDTGFEAEIEAILKDHVEGKTDPDAEAKAAAAAEVKCDSCDELKAQVGQLTDKLQALRAELTDIMVEYQELQGALIDVNTQAKTGLAETSVALDKLLGNEITDEAERSSWKFEDLVNKTSELMGKIDVEKLAGKLNDGMSQDPTDDVVDPTLTDTSDDPAKTDDDVDKPNERIVGYKDKYVAKREKDGYVMADAYVNSLLQYGLITLDQVPVIKG